MKTAWFHFSFFFLRMQQPDAYSIAINTLLSVQSCCNQKYARRFKLQRVTASTVVTPKKSTKSAGWWGLSEAMHSRRSILGLSGRLPLIRRRISEGGGPSAAC